MPDLALLAERFLLAMIQRRRFRGARADPHPQLFSVARPVEAKRGRRAKARGVRAHGDHKP